MVRLISPEEVAAAAARGLEEIAFNLPMDIQKALEVALEREECPRGRQALEVLLANAAEARSQQMPICQDTGSVWCCLELGPDTAAAGDVLSGVDAAVADVYERCRLRKSLVHDAAFDRMNTQDNTPAFTELRCSSRLGARLHLMAKGGGSDNASRVVMLPPGTGLSGVREAVLACVEEKAASACPPLVVGVGIGATFDKVAGLAKMALMRPLDVPAATEEGAALESELLQAINATGIGPAALGGMATALAVRVETAPCHIAALPVAVNMGCCALRRATYEL